MKTCVMIFSAIAMLACTGCARDFFATRNTPEDLQSDTHDTRSSDNPAHGATTSYASDGQSCNANATQRMKMYDHPDTYPISERERHDGYLSLYSECMREHNWQVAGPVRAPATMAANNDSNLASLSPAAGGNYANRSNTVVAGNTVVSSSSVPGATVVVIGGNGATPAQLSSLNPSAGGYASSNPTVIMVQSPQQSNVPVAPVASYYPPPASQTSLPVAVPMQPTPAQSRVATYTQPIPAQTPVFAPARPTVATYAPINAPQATALSPAGGSPMQRPSLVSAQSSLTASSAPPPSTAESNRQLESVLEQ